MKVFQPCLNCDCDADNKKACERYYKTYSQDLDDLLDNPPFSTLDLKWNPADTVVGPQESPRKSYPVYSGLLTYFPDAMLEVAHCSLMGNKQHHKDKPLHWDKNVSNDDLDALTRHLIDHHRTPIDDDGVRHLTKVAWRALAALQRELEG